MRIFGCCTTQTKDAIIETPTASLVRESVDAPQIVSPTAHGVVEDEERFYSIGLAPLEIMERQGGSSGGSSAFCEDWQQEWRTEWQDWDVSELRERRSLFDVKQCSKNELIERRNQLYDKIYKAESTSKENDTARAFVKGVDGLVIGKHRMGTLLRFLNARDQDVNKAYKMIQKAVQYRKGVGLLNTPVVDEADEDEEISGSAASEYFKSRLHLPSGSQPPLPQKSVDEIRK
jgi:hypothetical protein